MDSILQCISAFFACLGFAFVFRIHHNIRFAIIGSLGGTLGWIVFLLFKFTNNDVIQSLLAMICVALFAELMARLYKAPATIFLIVGCFPLVPGKGIYESMLHCVQGDSTLFIGSLIHTLAISGAIAFAILIVSTIFKIIKKYKPITL